MSLGRAARGPSACEARLVLAEGSKILLQPRRQAGHFFVPCAGALSLLQVPGTTALFFTEIGPCQGWQEQQVWVAADGKRKGMGEPGAGAEGNRRTTGGQLGDKAQNPEATRTLGQHDASVREPRAESCAVETLLKAPRRLDGEGTCCGAGLQLSGLLVRT